VLVDGRPSLFLDRRGARVRTFEDAADASHADRLDRALRALSRGLGRLGRSRLTVEEIDGEKARGSALADAFIRAGFRVGYRGLEIDRATGSSSTGDEDGDSADG
jgi:hypothetical protein